MMTNEQARVLMEAGQVVGMLHKLDTKVLQEYLDGENNLAPGYREHCQLLIDLRKKIFPE